MGKNKKQEKQENASTTNENNLPASINLEALAEVLAKKMSERGVKTVKSKPKYNVAVILRTDRGGEYIKSARKSEELEFLAGSKDNPVSMGKIEYKVDGTHYRAVFIKPDGEEIVLIDEDI